MHTRQGSGTVEPMRPPPPTPSQVADPEAVHRIVHQEIARATREAVDYRATISPLILVISIPVILIDPAPWRVVVVLAVSASVLALSWGSARRLRQSTETQVYAVANLVAMATLQAGMILVTGGLESPLLPVMVPLSVIAATALGRHAAIAVIATQVSALLLIATGQTTGLFPPLSLPALLAPPGHGPALIWTQVLVLCVSLTIGTMFGLHMRGLFEQMIRRGLEARAAQLDHWVVYSRDLEAVGGEIAHELKNPLASVKGLAALVARDLPAGRTAERLAVLRNEVDRMQAILEDFLTFTRPLAPLSLQAVDPAALCKQVVELHEGSAANKRIELRIDGTARPVQADGRKVLQVLVNLVQNALDAAPAGSEVSLILKDRDGGAQIAVADRGEGIAPALQDRVFEPGVTGKAHGHGLGLTIARSLTDQHGGRLTLQPRDGGGAVATLWLPAVAEVRP
jgi:two-component system sensor histidine kinase HydH